MKETKVQKMTRRYQAAQERANKATSALMRAHADWIAALVERRMERELLAAKGGGANGR